MGWRPKSEVGKANGQIPLEPLVPKIYVSTILFHTHLLGKVRLNIGRFDRVLSASGLQYRSLSPPRSKIVTKQISPWGKLVGSETQLKNITKTTNIETRKITKSTKSCWMGTEIRSLKVTAKGSWDCLPINHCLSHLLAHLSHTHLLGCVRLYVDLWTGVSNPRYFKTWMSPIFEPLFRFLPSPSFLLTLPSLFFFCHILLTSTLLFTPSSFLFRCSVLPCSPPTQQS